MEQKYDIKSLIESFTEHSKQFTFGLSELNKKRIENGEEVLPVEYNFSLSEALLNMCQEIQILKSKGMRSKVQNEFRERLQLILENYQTDQAFVIIPTSQIEHMVETIATSLDDMLCECLTY